MKIWTFMLALNRTWCYVFTCACGFLGFAANIRVGQPGLIKDAVSDSLGHVALTGAFAPASRSAAKSCCFDVLKHNVNIVQGAVKAVAGQTEQALQVRAHLYSTGYVSLGKLVLFPLAACET